MVAIYMAAMLFIGYKAKKSVKSPADFFTGGDRFGSALTAIARQAACWPWPGRTLCREC